MSEVTFTGQWIVTAPAPMKTASKSALSLNPTPVLSRPQWRKRREKEERRVKRGQGEIGQVRRRMSMVE